MTLPARWNRDGVVFFTTGQAYEAEAFFHAAGDDPHATEDIHSAHPQSITVRWRDLLRLEPIDPWPSLRVRYVGGDTACADTFAPRWRWRVDEFAAAVEALIEHASAHAPAVVHRGWLDQPVIEWERVRELPGGRVPLGPGAYRSATATGEPIVARRDAPTPFEALLQWTASTPDRPWRDHPREVVVTDEHVYARRRDRSAWRLPLSSLRAARGAPDGDAVFVFGRHTQLVLPARSPEGCPVARALFDALHEAS